MKDIKILIDELASDKNAQKRDFPPYVKSLFSLVGICGFFYLISQFYNPMSFVRMSNLHLLEVVTMALALFQILTLGFTALIPGASLKKYLYTSTGLLLLFLIIHLYRMGHTPIYAPIRNFCEVEAFSLSIITTLAAHFYLKLFELSKYQPVSLIILFALPLCGSILLHTACSSELFHVLSCHIITPIIFPIFYLKFFKNK